ncbi:MAG: sugar transferase [Alphaproteobacteria bacterium]|jgi:lipopolysaccharide/colanic/teichoic acid biosynthesis glycosyltransferase
MYQTIRFIGDFIIAAVLLIVLAPLITLLAIAIKWDSKGTVFFLQERIGKNGKPFKIIKFRSMYQDSDPIALARGNSDSRITSVGRIIRKYHCDEIAQLFNIIKGEMGLIGSRPEISKYVDMADPRWQKALSVAPGITGLAALKCARMEYAMLQLSHNPDETYRQIILPRKLRYDVIYASKQSLYLDLYIAKLTLKYII